MPSMSPETVAAGEVVGQWIKKRELTDIDQMKGIALSIRWVKNGVLSYGSISTVAKKSSLVHITMLCLWHCACSAC